MIYLDTSYLVRLYFEDPGYESVRALASTDHVVCAWHGQAETMAAFHRKLREKAIRLIHFRAMMDQFATDQESGAIIWLPAGPEILARIAQVYANLPASVYLRAADALHLATAISHGHKLVYSNDSHLLAAAPHFQLTAKNVIGKG